MDKVTITTEDNNTIDLVEIEGMVLSYRVVLDGHIIGHIVGVEKNSTQSWCWSLTKASYMVSTDALATFKNKEDAAKKVYEEHMKLNKAEYKANFLFGFEDNSVEALGYEFANAKTEEYQKECWSDLVEKIKQKDSDELSFDKESAKGLYRIFAGLSRSCYENAEVHDEAKPFMKKAYNEVLEWGEKNSIDPRGSKEDINPAESVRDRYSVSLIYNKEYRTDFNNRTIETALRVLITDASSEDEAIGKAIRYFDEEMKGFGLTHKVAIKTNKEE